MAPAVELTPIYAALAREVGLPERYGKPHLTYDQVVAQARVALGNQRVGPAAKAKAAKK